MLFKTIIATTLLTATLAVPAIAGDRVPPRAKAISKLDRKLDRLEHRGVIEQGSRLDRFEDRIDRSKEDRIDRRYNTGPKDRLEDRIDRRENRRDRRNNKR